ncbi:MAG: hypothetical protein RR063_06850, partial [Anaerovoracaceae bacterium]
ANNLENRDAYIIIGVRDSKDTNGFAVVGIKTDDTNRKDQENLITFLRDKKFAGGIRPEVYLKTIAYTEGVLLDIIIVKRTNNTPYYLIDSCDGVYKSNIYTRIGDTNTPTEKSADVDKIEYLWRKRFGIDLTPLEKIKMLLKSPNDWYPIGTDGVHSNSEFTNSWYHKQYPEFTISYKLDESRFSKGQINKLESDVFWMNRLAGPTHNASIYEISIKYHSTNLYSGLAVFADNYRFNRTLWQKKSIRYGNTNSMQYCFIEMDSLEFMLDNWLVNHHETIENTISNQFCSSLNPWKQQPEYRGNFNPYGVILVFKDNDEHRSFINYTENKCEELIEKVGNFSNPSAFDANYIDYLCKLGIELNNYLDQWRNQNLKTLT